MRTDGQAALASIGRINRDLEPCGSPDRRQRKMAKIDALTPAMKAAVHDLGWLVVKEFTEAGVTDAKKIRQLVHVALYEMSHEYRTRFEATKSRT